MMHNTAGLYNLLKESLAEINSQIVATTEDLQKQIDVLPHPDLASVYQLKHRDGSYPLTPLLAAKAQVLSGMAALKAADLQQRTSRR